MAHKKDGLWSVLPHAHNSAPHWSGTISGDWAGGGNGEGEALTLPSAGDIGDSPGSNWWTAWIDIGGEG